MTQPVAPIKSAKVELKGSLAQPVTDPPRPTRAPKVQARGEEGPSRAGKVEKAHSLGHMPHGVFDLGTDLEPERELAQAKG